MISQKSFVNDKNTLYLVATPIGNLKDITLRAIETLKMCDVIYCEDTRNSLTLLKHYEISKPLKSYHEYNKDYKDEEILHDLEIGLNVALISDAGTLIISDPGFEIVKKAILNNYNVVSIPGASAFLNALVVSKLPPKPFLFYGFLSNKEKTKIEELEKLKELPYTMVFYESPHRIMDTLNLMYQVFGNREISISRELTKKFEEIYWTFLEDNFSNLELKGEFSIVVKGYLEEQTEIDDIKLVTELIESGKTEKDAIKEIAAKYNIKKQDLYNRYVKLKK